jgi:hypothetical protein
VSADQQSQVSLLGRFRGALPSVAFRIAAASAISCGRAAASLALKRSSLEMKFALERDRFRLI